MKTTPTHLPKKAIARQTILAHCEKLSKVVKFLADDRAGFCFNSSCLRFGLCSHKWPAPAFAPAWLEKMPNDFSCRSAAKAESK